MKIKVATLGVAVALATGSVGIANALPVIQNGNFANVTFGATTAAGTTASTINRTPPPPSQQRPEWVTVNGWAVSGSKTAQAIWYQSAAGALAGSPTALGGPLLAAVTPPPHNEVSFVALNGDTGGGGNPSIQASIQQTVSGLTPGSRYVISFDWAGAQQNGVHGPTTDRLQVSLGDGPSQTTDAINVSDHGFTGWNHVDFGFTAESESSLLKFLAFGTPAGLPPMALLTSVSIAAPEPSELGMFGLGLLALVGLTVVARRRRHHDEMDSGAAA